MKYLTFLFVFLAGCTSSNLLVMDKEAMGYVMIDHDQNGILNTGDRIFIYYDRNKDGIPDEQVAHFLIISRGVRPLEMLKDKNNDGYWDTYYNNFDHNGVPLDSHQVSIKIMKDKKDLNL